MWKIEDYITGTINWADSYEEAMSFVEEKIKHYESKFWFRRGVHLPDDCAVIVDKDNQIIKIVRA